MRIERYNAFSLVEMLMALLVASLLMAALAPVMTKRINDKFDVSVSQSTFSIPPCVHINDTISDIEDTTCVVPNDVHSISAIIASGGGGGGGAADKVYDLTLHSIEHKGETGGHTSSSNAYIKKEITITKDMSDIEVELVAAGSAGGNGSSNEQGYPASQADCGNWGVYIDYTQNTKNNKDGSIQHSICVSRYNPGENRTGSDKDGSPDNARTLNGKGVTYTPAGNTCSTVSNSNCCWYGQTGASTCETSANGFDYSACNRTMCQWNAANTICANYKPASDGSAGRLPTRNDMIAWAPYLVPVSNTQPGILNKKAGSFPGLQLCTRFVDLADIYCGISRNCIGAQAGTGDANACIVDFHWLQDHYRVYIMPTTINADGLADDSASMNVRCVIDKVSEFKSYRGGGGAGGNYAKIKIPNEVLKKAFEPDENGRTVETLTLTVTSGNGGTRDHTGNGWTSGIRLQRNSTILFYFAINNNAGSASSASISANGYDGEAKNPEMGGYNSGGCYFVNIYDPKWGWTRNESAPYLPCSEVPNLTVMQGKNGSNGVGGAAYWNGSWQDGGSLGTSSSINGGDGAVGAGGGGGVCTEGPTRLSANCGKGGNGGGGAVKITYKRTYPGAGGGGGGAGSVAYIQNIPVNPNEIISVQAGKRGMGGYAGNDGVNGGNSYIIINNDNSRKYEITGGEGGKKGIAAVISPTGNVTFAVNGDGGKGGTVDSATLNKFGSKDKYYPEDTNSTEEAKGKKAPDILLPDNTKDEHYMKAPGGNGGVNSKISLSGFGNSNNRIPCGGFSTTSVMVNKKAQRCDVQDYRPLMLSRIISASDINKNVFNSFILGSTGGGGGGWNNDSSPSASSGADGMGGYVAIFYE